MWSSDYISKIPKQGAWVRFLVKVTKIPPYHAAHKNKTTMLNRFLLKQKLIRSIHVGWGEGKAALIGGWVGSTRHWGK